MVNAPSFLILGLLIINRAVACPSQYTNVDGACVHSSTGTMLFCQANAYCASVNGELIRGQTFMSVQTKSFSGRPSHHWIGLTDLLNERKDSKSGWRWTDGALDPTSSDINWKPIWDPSGGGEDCVVECKLSFGNMMCDVDCTTFESYAMCQPRSQPSLLRNRIYHPVPIPVGLPPEEYAQGGWWKLSTGVSSKMRCAFLCSSEPNDSCVSFYFNKASKHCRLVLYTDGTFNMGSAAGWQKFVKQN